MSKPPAPAPAASGQRIAKLLARAGIASRREVERMIEEGRVALNGSVLTTPATVLPSLAGVTVDGKAVRTAEPARLFRFHKPAGLLTTERDPKGRRTIYDALPKDLPRVMPVGRLDLNTEGLLLLTTDGELKRQLELPSTGVERTYRARAFGEISQEQLEELIHGITIEGVRYGPIDANLERRTGRNQWIEMRLTEGKNREVRRVLEHLGLQVSRLIRTAYGPFEGGDLPPGTVAEVPPRLLEHFTTSLKLPRSAMPVEERRPAREPEHTDAVPRPRKLDARPARASAEPGSARKRPGEPARREARSGTSAPTKANRRNDGEPASGPRAQRPLRSPGAKPSGSRRPEGAKPSGDRSRHRTADAAPKPGVRRPREVKPDGTPRGGPRRPSAPRSPKRPG